MSSENWRARYESQALYSSADALDNTPLLGDEAYTEIPVHDGGAAAAATGPSGEWAGHCHWKAASEPPRAVPQLIAAIALCALLMVCELIGGYMAGSLAIMCDAAHLLSDCGGFGLALLAFYLAERPTDTRMSYGYKRAEVLGAISSVLLIWLLTGAFVYMACERLYSGDYDINPDSMMVVSGAGVLINIAMALVLHGCCTRIAHHHSHGGAACAQHSHARHDDGDSAEQIKFYRNGRESRAQTIGSLPNGDFTLKDMTAGDATECASDTVSVQLPHKNINLRAALIHVIGDLIQSCGVFIAAVIIKFYAVDPCCRVLGELVKDWRGVWRYRHTGLEPSWKVADPVCTLVSSVVVLTTTVRVVHDALIVLMQGVPKHFQYKECLWALQGVSGVRAVHSLHAWGLSTHHVVLTGHVVIDEYADNEMVLRVCVGVARRYGADAVTLQLERYQPAMSSCSTCVEQPGARA